MGGTHSLILPVLYLACGVVIFLLGLTLMRVGRSSAPTRAAALMLFFAGLGPLLSASGMILQNSLKEGSVLFTSMLVNFEYLWEFYFPSLLLFALTFPRESRLLQRYPGIALLIFTPYILHLMAFMFGDRMLEELTRLPRALIGAGRRSGEGDMVLSGFDAVVGALVRVLESVHRALFALVNVVYSVLALDLLWRSQQGLPNRRLIRQMRTVGIGVAVSLGCYTLAKTSLMTGAKWIPESSSQAILSLSLVASGSAIAYAVIRQQFLGVRHVLQRAVLYAAIAVLLGAVYLLAVRPVTSFFAQYSSVGQNAFEAGFVVLVVLAFQPVMERAENLLESALVRSRGSMARRFKLIGDAVAAAGTFESLDEAVVKGLRDALDASDVRLAMLESAGDPLAVALAEIGEPVQRIELLREPRPVKRRARFLPRRRARADEPPVRPRLESDQLPARVELFVPVLQDGACVAYVALGEKVYGLGYGAEEMGHLAVLSTQIGAALLNIRLLKESIERKVFEEELRIARQIQMKMLPGQPPVIPGFGLYGVAVPSRQVGGDYYDFIMVDDRFLVVVVADVSGKGIPASLLTATLQATVRTGADAQIDPPRMLDRLNRLIYQNTSASEFATAFYGVVDTHRGTLRYANAGHEFPFVVSGGRAQQLEESGIVLGCLADFSYSEYEVPMPQGGALVVFTDGVTDSESRAGESYGSTRLRTLLESDGCGSARDLCRRVIEDVRTFGDGENQDDLTLVVLTRDQDSA
ncbi:MAG TPA: PP2C family protein-serine/threonine phosphatase [Candidatus Krumholzibacteria bacterium]|nr:PP2C family protein-serine/threonine phosphatase [Candidatus Krumholzibacteria bacterium]